MDWSVLGGEELSTTAEWQPEPLARGTLSILTSSLITLSLCVWTALHLNIPPWHATTWTKLRRKLKWLVVGVVLPDYVLFVAFAQWIATRNAHRHILKTFVEQGLQEEQAPSRIQVLWRALPRLPTLRARTSELDNEHAAVPTGGEGGIEMDERNVEPQDEHDAFPSSGNGTSDDIGMRGNSAMLSTAGPRHPWTIRHTHYVQMGGFVFNPSQVFSKNGNLPDFDAGAELGTRLALTVQGVICLSQEVPNLIPDISEAYIKDKSNADNLSQLLAVMQACWFLMQFIARLSVGLPVTILELNIIAHIVFSVFVFACWWKKPLDIGTPTEINVTSLKESSLLAAMYVRSRVGYLRRVDEYHPIKRPHKVFLDIAPATSDFTPPQQPVQEGLSLSDTMLNSEERRIESSPPTAPRSFQMALGDSKNGIRVVAESHYSLLGYRRFFLYDSPRALFGNRMVLEGEVLTCTCTKISFSKQKRKASRVTITDSHRYVFELASTCDLLRDLGVPTERNESAIKAYLMSVCRPETQRIWIAHDFIVEPPSEIDIQDIPALTGMLLSVFFLAFSSVFGMLHALAWNGPFRTDAELVFWRIATATLLLPLVALFIVMFSLAIFFVLFLLRKLMGFLLLGAIRAGIPLTDTRLRQNDPVLRLQMDFWGSIAAVLPSNGMRAGTRRGPRTCSDYCGLFAHILIMGPFFIWVVYYCLLFFPARFYFLAECVINLIYAPPRVFELPSWVSYIPHLS